MHIRRFLLVVLSVLVLVGPTTSWAGPTWKERREAQQLVTEGTRAEKGESWQEARDAYQAALDLHDTPRARKGLAKALFHLGLLIEAREHAQNVADNKRAGWWDRKHCRELLKKIEEQMPHLTVNVSADFDGTVRVDDESLPSDAYGERREINPGTVVVHAEAEGFLPFEQSVVLGEGGDETVSVQLEAEPVPEPVKEEKEVSTEDGSTRKTIGYISLVVGGVGLAAGTAFGFAARSTRSDLDSACVNDVCDESQREAYDKGKMQANIATGGFLVGGVGLGLGAVLLLTGPKDKESEVEKAAVRPYVGPTGAGVYGRF